MRGTSSGVPRAARRIGAVAAAAAAIGIGVVGLTSHSAGAASTAVVHFTANGIEVGDHEGQTSVAIAPGSDVVFSNDIDPSQKVAVLGTVTGLLKSVTVTVTGATQQQFTVGRNQERVVSGYSSGSKPFVVDFSATYQAQTLLGPGSKSAPMNGTITVAATPGKSAPPATVSSTPSPTRAKTSTPPPARPTSQPSSSAPTSSASAQVSPTISGYTPPPSDVASQVMPPPGHGGAYHGGDRSTGTTDPTSTRAASTPPTATHSSPRHTQEPVSTTSSSAAAAGPTSDDPGGGDSNGGSQNQAGTPERAMDTTASTSAAGSPLGANWSVIAAIALLSTVSLALVRTLVTQRRV